MRSRTLLGPGALVICVMSALLQAAPPQELPAGYRVVEVKDGGSVRGRICYAGDVPELSPLQVSSDRAGCGDLFKPNESLLLGPGRGIANCVVSFDGISEGKAPPEAPAIALDQKQCIFTPHVFSAPAGAPLVVKNSDPVFHNVHAYSMPGMNTRFNVGLPIQGSETEVRLGKPEMLVIRCDSGHRWMTGYVHVAANPYHALTGPDGQFVIDRLPPGTLEMHVWHETIGELRATVKLAPRGTLDLAISATTKPTRGLSMKVTSATAAEVTTQ